MGILDDGLHHETAEAREIREAYNRTQGSSRSLQVSTERDAKACMISLPTSAGTAWVDLSEFGAKSGGDALLLATKTRAKQGGARDCQGSSFTLQRSSREISESLQVPESSPLRNSQSRAQVVETTGASKLRSIEIAIAAFRRRTALRRHSDSSVASTFCDARSASRRSSLSREGDSKDSPVSAIEVFKLRGPFFLSEQAKRSATRSAQMCEAYVAHEMRMRQMWRARMGSKTPGLKVSRLASQAPRI